MSQYNYEMAASGFILVWARLQDFRFDFQRRLQLLTSAMEAPIPRVR
jgi:hypothetical protein